MNRPLILVPDPTLRALLALTMMACGCVAGGCEDPNKLFEGVWETTDDAHDALGGQFVGAPTLVI
ncbi:MAG: hypothetical protein QF464_09480 [Myxococcota bacterium]|jgi:hypothetical protein|nr:hypothetical protein [Myxococcota bacterium]